MDSRALWVVALLATVALAGCSEDGDGTAAIEIVSMPADAATEPLALSSKVAADSYSWNMGDGRAPLTGADIEHTYGVANGEFTVTLTTTTGGTPTTHAPLKVTFGTGQNTAPEMQLEVEWQWVQVGEEVTFSLAGSQDADGDPILAQWLCSRKSDIGIAGVAHAHGSAGGIQYGTSNTKLIPHLFLNATDTLPAGTAISGDICAGMVDTHFSEDATITGSFAERGIYEVTVLGRDPSHFGIPATISMYVTDDARHNGTETITFSEEIATPLPESMDPIAEQLENQDHFRIHDFEIIYPTKGVQATLTPGSGDGVPVEMTYQIKKGDTSKYGPTADPMDKPADFFKPGGHTATVVLRQGSNVSYDLEITFDYVTDPTLLFDDPAGH